MECLVKMVRMLDVQEHVHTVQYTYVVLLGWNAVTNILILLYHSKHVSRFIHEGRRGRTHQFQLHIIVGGSFF